MVGHKGAAKSSCRRGYITPFLPNCPALPRPLRAFLLSRTAQYD